MGRRARSRVSTKRIYEPASRADGTRVLVMRLWPRGIRKSAVDLWLRDLGAELRNLRLWHAGQLSWPELRRRYLAGLKRPPRLSPSSGRWRSGARSRSSARARIPRAATGPSSPACSSEPHPGPEAMIEKYLYSLRPWT
jgi:uncharacterized protein DUF488